MRHDTCRNPLHAIREPDKLRGQGTCFISVLGSVRLIRGFFPLGSLVRYGGYVGLPQPQLPLVERYVGRPPTRRRSSRLSLASLAFYNQERMHGCTKGTASRARHGLYSHLRTYCIGEHSRLSRIWTVERARRGQKLDLEACCSIDSSCSSA